MIVMIAGKRRSGKTTVRKYLMDKGLGYEHMPITEGLYDILWQAFDIEIYPEHGDLTSQERKLLIKTGELCRLAKGDDYLIRTATGFIEPKDNGKVYIIDQFRFPEEYDYMVESYPEHDVMTIRLWRRGDNPEPGFDDDPTENALDFFRFDASVWADPGDIDSLCSEAYSRVEERYSCIEKVKVDRVACRKYQIKELVDSFECDEASTGGTLSVRSIEERLVGWLWDFDYFKREIYRDC